MKRWERKNLRKQNVKVEKYENKSKFKRILKQNIS